MVNDDFRPMNYQKLMGWALLLAGAVSFAWNGWITINAFATRYWDTSEGMVYSSEIEFATASLGTSAFYHPNVTYRYRIEGKVYTGQSIYYSDLAFLSFEAAQELVEQFPTSQVTTVYYNPRDPEETVLVPGPSPVMWMLFGPAILFLVMGQRVVRQKGSR